MSHKRIISSSFIVATLLFFLCFSVYLSNGLLAKSSAWDNYPNTVLAFNFFENRTVHLNALRNGYYYSPPIFGDVGNYALVESEAGHLTSAYPIGASLITAPLYFIYYLCVQVGAALSGNEINLLLFDNESYRQLFEKLTSVTLTSASVSILFLYLRNRFPLRESALASLVFAFATSTWPVSSQSLWQHTAGNFALILSAFCLIKAKIAEGSRIHNIFYLSASGVLCGLLPAIRPSNLLFSIALGTFALFSFRKNSITFFIGSLSILASTFWNLYYFGNILSGGYEIAQAGEGLLYEFTAKKFLSNFIKLNLSPSRGLFVYSPILLFSALGIPSLWNSRTHFFDQLFICLSSASLLLFLSFCFYVPWEGGYSFGPRLLTDLLPILCGLLGYGIGSPIMWVLERMKQHVPT